MRCETCQGTGSIRHDWSEWLWGTQGALLPCPDCGGCAVSHCCEGLTACNDPVEKETEAGTDSPNCLPTDPNPETTSTA